jgi:DNA polymerase-3 subunit delta'
MPMEIHHAYIIEDKDYALEFANKYAKPYDIAYVMPEKNSISVEQIRQINSEIFIKPDGERKIYILEAHNITIQAQNALLKTLEEPPSYAIIILIGKRSSFLNTILSRAIYIPSFFNFPEIEKEVIKFVEEFEKSDFASIFDHYHFLEENKERIEEILDFMQLFYRERMLNFIQSSNINKILIIQKAKENLRSNANFQITIENMLIQIRKK